MMAATDSLREREYALKHRLIGIGGNRVVRSSLMYCVEQTHAVAAAMAAHNYEQALALRGTSFGDAFRSFAKLLLGLA